jgi:hypothetical protein
MSLTIIPVIPITMIPGGAIHTGGGGRLLASGFIIIVILIGGIEIQWLQKCGIGFGRKPFFIYEGLIYPVDE